MRKKKMSALLSVFALAALTTAAFAACKPTETHVHKYTSSVTKQATCTEEGVETFTCEAGDDTYTKPIAKLTHKYSEKVTKEATCAKEGEKTFTCDNCGDSYTEAIAKLDHTIVIDEAVEATEESTGLTEGKHCSVCGEVLVAQTEIPKKEPPHEHSFVNYEVTKKATCTEMGIRTYTCECGETYIRKLAALGHTGYENDGVCDRCDYTAQAIVDNTYYLTLDEALAAVTSNPATITLNSDAKLSDNFAAGLALTLEMGNYTLDLGGYKLVVATFNASSNTTDGFTIKNGMIRAINGGTIAAPNGTVTLNNVLGISFLNSFTLDAAQNSFHFEGIVNFLNQGMEPAPVSIPVDTHVVAEKNAQVTVAAINVVATTGTNKEFSLEINAGAQIITSAQNSIIVDDEAGEAKVSVAMNVEAGSAVSVSGANVVAIETFTQSANEKTTVTSTVVSGIAGETVSVTPPVANEETVTVPEIKVALPDNATPGTITVGTTEDIDSEGKSDNLIINLPEGKTPTTNGVAEVNGVMYQTLKEAIENVTDGATITLLKDSVGDGIKVTSGKNFTVDFNGYTYDVNGTLVGSTGTETNSFQLLKDSTITFKNGTLTSTNSTYASQILIQNYSNLTLENMTVSAGTPFDYIISNNNGNVVIKDTTINAAEGKVAFDVCRYSSYVGPEVTVEGNSVINGKVEISCSGAKDGAIHKLNVTGGTFNGKIYFYNTCPDFVGNITGGTFTSDPSAYVAEGYVAEEISDKYVVHGIVKVGDSYYTTLAEAVAKAESGATVTLLKNTTVTSTVVVTKELTLDLNGNNITGSGWILQAQGADGDLTVMGTGTVKSTGNCVANAISGAKLTIKSGTYEAQESCVMAFDGATVVIDGGTFTTVDNFVVGTNGSTGRGKNSITINNGTFNGNIKSSGYIACGIYVANDDTVVVNGGTFNVVNGVGILARSGNTTVSEKVVFNVTSDGTIKEGKVGVAKINIEIPHDIVLDQKAGYPGGDPTVVAPAYKAYKKAGNDNQLFYTKQLPKEVVVECNDIYYTSLQAALDAAEVDATVTLYGNIEGDRITVTKSVTIDGNGYTLKDKKTDGRAIWIDKSGVTLTLKSLMIDGDSKCQRGVQVNYLEGGEWNYATVIIDHCTITKMTYYAINLCSNTTVDLQITNSFVSGWAAINAYGTGNKITVKNSFLKGINDKGYNKDGWNDFATICLEGDTTYQTDAHSADYIVLIEDSTIIASQTTGNKQRAVGFNGQSVASTVTLKNCTISYPDNSELYYDNGLGNKLVVINATVNGEIVNLESASNNIMYAWMEGEDLEYVYEAFSVPFEKGYLMDEEYIILLSDVVLEKDVIFSTEENAIASTGGWFYLRLDNDKDNPCTITGTGKIVLPSNVSVLCDRGDILEVFKAQEEGRLVEVTAGEEGSYIYQVASKSVE